MPPANDLKQRIKNGETIVALRVLIDIERRQLENALTKGTYDLIYIDGQHCAFSEAQLIGFCSLAEEIGLPVQMRIPHTRHTYLIGRYLDFGLAAILVPEVVEETTVEEAVAFTYYPQIGCRSWGGAARHGLKAWSGGGDRQAYAQWWNKHVVLAMQLESVAAVSKARMLAKAGVDYMAFGPNDLQFSLEGHPHYPLRTVDDCMRNVSEQLQGTGIRLGMAVTTLPDERGKYLDMGITVFQESPAG